MEPTVFFLGWNEDFNCMIVDFISNIAQRIGMDRAIAYSSGSKILGGFTGILSVFFISTFLTGVEQGFYYTFGSILALQVFFELGLTGIMTQYVAHEVSHLHLNAEKQYEGEEKYRSRLASLVHFCAKWYSVLAILVFIFLLFVGLVFFSRYGEEHSNEVLWRMPWLLICASTSLTILQSPFISIFMGLGKVKDMSKVSFLQQIIIPLLTWTGFVCGLKLYVLPLSSLLSVLIWQLYVWKSGLAEIVVNLWKVKITESVAYFKEIFPYQWKIALSWVSGYFIFQLFNPVLFATEGAIVAGQMGITLQALNAIHSFSVSWLNTKVPLYSQLIALKDYSKLDKIFNRTLQQMTGVCVVLLVLFFVAIWLLNVTQLQFNGNVLASRFLPTVPLFLLMFTIYLNQYTTSWATYLRCHKQEPFLIISICGAFADGLSTLVLGNLFGLYGITLGYCILTILFFPWGYKIFKTKKAEWHYE